jgi:hypothetical protein
MIHPVSFPNAPPPKREVDGVVSGSLSVQGGGAKRRLVSALQNEPRQPGPEGGRIGRIGYRERGRVYLGEEMPGSREGDLRVPRIPTRSAARTASISASIIAANVRSTSSSRSREGRTEPFG